MRTLRRIGLVALLLPALFACNRQRAVQIDWAEGEQAAVAFLGYYDSFAAFSSAPSFIRLSKAFPQIVEADQVEVGVGRELYLVVPRDAQDRISVYTDGGVLADEGMQACRQGDPGAPMLVFCNYYDPDSRVVCSAPDGQQAAFVPQLDDAGKVVLTVGGGVRDISLPIPEPLEGYAACDYPETFEGESLGIGIRLKAGRPVLTVHAEPLEAIGFSREEFALAEGDNEFSGVNGLCKGVFLGTVGQDFNPVACVVMENGDVKKCSVFYAVQNGGPELSDALPGFKDVVGFESGGTGDSGTAEGGTAFEYRSIYALDARGERTEIPHFNDYGLFVAEDAGDALEAVLTPDWHFILSRYSGGDGALEEVCSGSFASLERGDGLDRFSFSLNRVARRDGEDFQVDERVRKGRFSAREVGLSYEVNLSGADFFKSGTEFRDSRLVGAAEDIEYD